MRINKYLAMCNLGSRRDVEDLIIKGKITVNEKVCRELATDIAAGFDVVTYEGQIIKPVKEKIYIALNKPKGYIVTKRDEYNRKTVFDLLPKFEADLFAVGRLDKNSEGLLLLTNDGDFANTLMHPRYKFSKIYKVEVQGKIKPFDLHQLQEGMFIDGEKTLSARVFIKKSDIDSTILRFTIYQGKNRQIRKMLETLEYKVISLKRLQIGGIKLGELPLGAYRPLKPREVRSILEAAEGKKGEQVKRETKTTRQYSQPVREFKRSSPKAGRGDSDRSARYEKSRGRSSFRKEEHKEGNRSERPSGSRNSFREEGKGESDKRRSSPERENKTGYRRSKTEKREVPGKFRRQETNGRGGQRRNVSGSDKPRYRRESKDNDQKKRD
jgi:23S rRNA pseudouridine2605 synthase